MTNFLKITDKEDIQKYNELYKLIKENGELKNGQYHYRGFICYNKEDGDNFIRCKYLSIRKDYDNILWFLNGNVQLLRKFYENHIRK